MYRVPSGPAVGALIVLVNWVYQASKSTKNKKGVIRFHLGSMSYIPWILRSWNQAFKAYLNLSDSETHSLACTYCISLQIQDIHIAKNDCAVTQCAIARVAANTCMRSAAHNHYFLISIALGDKTASVGPPRRHHLWPGGPHLRSQIQEGCIGIDSSVLKDVSQMMSAKSFKFWTLSP